MPPASLCDRQELVGFDVLQNVHTTADPPDFDTVNKNSQIEDLDRTGEQCLAEAFSRFQDRLERIVDCDWIGSSGSVTHASERGENP